MGQNYEKWEEVPKEIKERLRWTGGIWVSPDNRSMRVSCETFLYEQGELEVKNGIYDTSSFAFDGIPIKKQLTFHEINRFGGRISFHFHPITSTEESKE